MSDIKFDANNGDIIKTIQQSVMSAKIDVKPGDYTTRDVARVPNLAHSKQLHVASLTSLIEYINKAVDGETRRNPFVQVVDEETVYFYNDIAEETEVRFSPISAHALTPPLTLEKYMPKEEAHIMLQSRFVESPLYVEDDEDYENDGRDNLLLQLGTIIADEEVRQDDDGVTQRITQQQGIKRSESQIANPVYLSPYRTFTEIDQPASPFIVRLKHDSHYGIQVALFIADGGAWRNVARQSIRDYIAAALVDKEIPVIA